MCATVAEIMNGNGKFLIFSKFNKANSVKNHRTMTNFELDLHIPVKYSYTKFELNVCKRCRDNERKGKI